MDDGDLQEVSVGEGRQSEQEAGGGMGVVWGVGGHTAALSLAKT